MHERTIDFASWANVFGLWSLSALAGVCLLCAVACAVLALSGKVGMRRGLSIASVVLFAGAAVAGGLVRRDLMRFHTLAVADDGTWSVRNGLGVELARYAPQARRTVHFRSEYLQGRSSWYRTWVEIEGPDGSLVGSVHTHIDSQREAIEAMRALVADREPAAPHP